MNLNLAFAYQFHKNVKIRLHLHDIIDINETFFEKLLLYVNVGTILGL